MGVSGRKTLVLIVVVCLVAAGMVWFRSHLFSSVVADLNQRIDSLKVSGFIITYDSLSVNWRKNTIEIDQLVLEKNAYDTTCTYPEFVKIGKVRAEGLSLISLVFRKILHFDNLYLENPHVVMRPNSLFKPDSAGRQKNKFTFRADNVSMKSLHIEYLDSAACDNILGLKSDLVIRDVKLDFHSGQPLDWQLAMMTFDSLQVRMHRGPSTYEVLQAKLDFTKKFLDVDTIRLIPDFGKLEYGRKFGYEVDRIEGIIPFVHATGFSFNFKDSSWLNVRQAKVQFFLKIFRDKRLPFRKKTKPLPTSQLRDLPFALRIDTLEVVKSFVQYEEFENGATEPGKIYFDDVAATFRNFGNATKEGIAMEAHALLLGDGKVTLSAVFALGDTKQSRMHGSLQHFSLPKINSMLTPVTNLAIESGTMDKLLFNFSYNANASAGEVELNYRDLKLATYKDGKKTDGAREKDNLKTFLMNLFVFKKKMDGKTPEEKRTGAIHYVRDDSRSVFNYWAKSVLSGIKEACDLDKKEMKTTKRESKKEERLTKREERKQRKAAKKKERG